MYRHMADYPDDESPTPSPPPNSPVRGRAPAGGIAANELSRAIEATGMTSARSLAANGLMRALEAATRARGGSAALRPNSGNPSQADQARPDRFPRDDGDGYRPGPSARYPNDCNKNTRVGNKTGFTTPDGYSQQGSSHQHRVNFNGVPSRLNSLNNNGQQADFSHFQTPDQQDSDTQNGPGYRNYPVPQNIPVRNTSSLLDRLMHETDRYLYNRLLSISQNLGTLAGMPPDVAAVLSKELFNVYEDYAVQSRKLNTECCSTEAERDSLVREIAKSQGVAAKYQRDAADCRRLLHDAVASRDHAISKNVRFKNQISELAGKRFLLEQQLDELQEKFAISVKSLNNELQFKDEQIQAKRTLWITAHGEQSSAAVESPQDLYGTPSMDRQMISNSQQHWGPPEMTDESQQGGSGMALVPFEDYVGIAEDFGADFENVYDMVLKWTQKYTGELKSVEADQATSRTPDLWAFMKKCTYEDKDKDKEAHSHVVHLLRDAKARPFLIMRMIVQILCNEVWTASTFEDFDPASKPRFEYFRERLQTRGLSSKERATVICEQADMIEEIIQQPMEYLVYRRTQITKHGRALRAMIGTLLDTGAERRQAAGGLNDIATEAFDLSAKMFTSNRSFVIKFPECATKFMHTSMVSRNPYDSKAPLDSQLRQTRVKLAITPIITMRDDRFMTIQVKDIQRSHVIIMI